MQKFSRHPLARPKVVILGVSLLALCFVGVAAHAWFLENPIYPAFDPKHPTPAQQEAIEDAVSWRESQILSCMTVITPAVHPETGARYTFSDSCMAPGWTSQD